MKRDTEYRMDIRGNIRLFWVGHDASELILSRSNVITYSAADIMAQLAAGNQDYVPNRIGFIYGPSASPGASMADPDSLPLAERRDHAWDDIALDVSAAGGNILVCPLVLHPSVAVEDDGSSGRYTANKVTYSSHTGSGSEYAFPVNGTAYAGTVDSMPSVYFYQAVLLNRRLVTGLPVYTPFARVMTGTAPFTARPSGKEQAIYWDIVFK